MREYWLQCLVPEPIWWSNFHRKRKNRIFDPTWRKSPENLVTHSNPLFRREFWTVSLKNDWITFCIWQEIFAYFINWRRLILHARFWVGNNKLVSVYWIPLTHHTGARFAYFVNLRGFLTAEYAFWKKYLVSTQRVTLLRHAEARFAYFVNWRGLLTAGFLVWKDTWSKPVRYHYSATREYFCLLCQLKGILPAKFSVWNNSSYISKKTELWVWVTHRHPIRWNSDGKDCHWFVYSASSMHLAWVEHFSPRFSSNRKLAGLP